MPNPSPAKSPEAGFTLIEVVVALALTALVLLGARSIFEQMGDYSEAVVSTASETQQRANGEHLLRAMLGRVEISQEAGRRFEGTREGVRFHSWCEVPGGWLERCATTFGVIPLGDDSVLALAPGSWAPVAIRRGFGHAQLLYLRGAEGGGQWSTTWSSAVEAPLAVGLVVDGDTSILRIGERG